MTIESSHLPRVLVISAAPFSTEEATGITLTNLFSGWPADKLAQICWGPTHSPPSICEKSWVVSGNRGTLVGSLRALRSSLARKRATTANFDAQAYGIAGGTSSGSFLASLADAAPYLLPNGLAEWVREFDPQVIYSPLGSLRIMSAVLKLSERQGIPVVPHFMDDWPSTVYASGFKYSLMRAMLGVKLRRIMSRSPVGLAISEAMAEEYQHRYGLQFKEFMNCVEVSSARSQLGADTDDAVVFSYVGGLHLNRWRSLLDVAAALEMNREQGGSVWFDIYAPKNDIDKYRSEFEGIKVVRNMTSLNYVEVRERLCKSDVLVHVESFAPNDSKYTRLSISTKIPQYLAVGRPILAYGPKSVSSVAYIERCQCGMVVFEEGCVSDLLHAVNSLVEHPELRQRLGRAAQDAAWRNHEASVVRSRFGGLLAHVAALPLYRQAHK